MNCYRCICGLLFLLPVLFSARAQESHDQLMSTYDVQHYDLSLSFDLQKKKYHGSVGIAMRTLQSLNTITLDASNATLTIDSVIWGDSRLNFSHEINILTIVLPSIISSEANITLEIYYHGVSVFQGHYDSGGIYFISSGRLATISEPNFAREWWPCKDIPSDKATAHINITVPDSLTAVSNGVLTKVEHHNGSATFIWETHYPTATYLFFISIARYKEFSDSYADSDGTKMPVKYYVYPEDEEKAKKDFQNTTKILKYFSQTFCEYPFLREKFGYAEVDGDLTMENQTLCSIQKNMITGSKKFESTFVHETSHQWWGNLITPENWKHTWLSEGFATYAEALYLEHTNGHDAYKQSIDEKMGTDQGLYAGSIIGKNDTSFWDAFAPRVYNKGAIVLHMLRGITGDSMFFAIMKNYLNNPRLRYGNAKTEDFIAECERVYGKRLKWFFDEWVYAQTDSIDRPSYEYTWKAVPAASPAYRVNIDLRQTTASILLYKMPVTITITSQKSNTTYIVVDSLAVQSFTFPSANKPEKVEIDKENNIMKMLTRKEGL